MNETISLLLPIILPIVMGAVLFFMKPSQSRRPVLVYTGTALVLTTILIIPACLTPETPVVLFYLTKTLPIMLKLDGIGRFFLIMVSIVWLLAGFFSFTYMKHEKNGTARSDSPEDDAIVCPSHQRIPLPAGLQIFRR